MKSKNVMAAMLIIAMVVVALPSLVAADTYLKQVVHQDALEMKGQTIRESNDTTEMWMTKDMARMNSAEGIVIFRADKDSLYMIDDAQKSYTPMAISDLGDIGKMMGVEGEQAEMMKQQMAAMMAMMQLKVTVTPSDETKEVSGYKCKKYDLDMKMGSSGAVKSEAWVTKDIDVDFSVFKKTSFAMMLNMPGAQEALAEFEKMDGIPVLTTGVVTLMGATGKTTTELIAVEEKDAPAGSYDIPEGYKAEKMKMPYGG